MKSPKPQATPKPELPSWRQIPVEQQRAMIQILSEMIYRRMKQEVCSEPRQDS